MAGSNRGLEEAIDDFSEPIMAVVIIGAGGSKRVWLSDELENEEQHEWAAKNIHSAAKAAREMTPGAGRA